MSEYDKLREKYELRNRMRTEILMAKNEQGFWLFHTSEVLKVMRIIHCEAFEIYG